MILNYLWSTKGNHCFLTPCHLIISFKYVLCSTCDYSPNRQAHFGTIKQFQTSFKMLVGKKTSEIPIFSAIHGSKGFKNVQKQGFCWNFRLVTPSPGLPLGPWRALKAPGSPSANVLHEVPSAPRGSSRKPQLLGENFMGRLHRSYWKWPFIVGFPIENGDFP